MITLYRTFLLGCFQYLYLLELFVFVCLFILNGLKVKNYSKINVLISLIYKNENNFARY